MNFQDISPIPDGSTLLDIAFTHAKSESKKVSVYKANEVTRQRRKNLAKIEAVHGRLLYVFKTIVLQFPRFNELVPFYKELFICYIDEVTYKQDLSKLKWAELQTKKFFKKYKGLVKASTDEKHIVSLTKEFYGRISSVVKQISPSLDRMTSYRKHLRKFPAIKNGCVSVCLFGFPNVGKSTLLSKMTSANPEIANYAFTTKGLNIGYNTQSTMPLQVIDTPGTLHRFDEMNDIEKMAYLVMKTLADVVIVVIDVTNSYSLEQQKSLYELVLQSKKDVSKVFVYFSKTDLLKPSLYSTYSSTFSACSLDEILSHLKIVSLEKEKELLLNKHDFIEKELRNENVLSVKKKTREDILKRFRKK